jgi:RNA polymerase sigma-70 factor (ECF subfamily)
LKFTGKRRVSAAPSSRGEEEAQFAQLFEQHKERVLSYALRRTQRPEDAADVVAETFLVAWRRGADVPDGSDALAWLYGVARRVLANQRRGEGRRLRLADRMREELTATVPSHSEGWVDSAALQALHRLDEKDSEVLLLAGWEGFEPREIAKVLGISATAARNRLHRARKLFKTELEGESAQADTTPAFGSEGAC